MKISKTTILNTLMSVLLFSVSGLSADRSFQLKSPEGEDISVTLSNFDTTNAAVFPKGDFCSNGNIATAWTATNSKLTVNGKEYHINRDNSLGWFEIGLTGIASIFYYQSYTFKNKATCKAAASQASNFISEGYIGPIKESDLKSMKLSFVDRKPNLDTSAVDYILHFDFVKSEIKLLRLKNSDSSLFDPNSWTAAGTGSL